ncbi:hypothetical protein QJQ45_009666 [Haematococcus lacustris]|nr:hypothetical protein QJQ45_009666 [Haematococcus lacustris]
MCGKPTEASTSQPHTSSDFLSHSSTSHSSSRQGGSSTNPTAKGRQHPHGRVLTKAAKGRHRNGCKAAGPDMEAAAAESTRDMLAGLNANVEAQLHKALLVLCEPAGDACAVAAHAAAAAPDAVAVAAVTATAAFLLWLLLALSLLLVAAQLMKEMRSKGAAASCKTLFVLALLDRLVAEGHRTLIFSQSRVMLDILQAGIQARSMSFCRIDGTVLRPEDRQAAVQRFQEPCSTIPVFLLTSQVGGLGLTLTAANRVVIVDPSWNPSVDNQAVDRAYRIGQTRNVSPSAQLFPYYYYRAGAVLSVIRFVCMQQASGTNT